MARYFFFGSFANATPEGFTQTDRVSLHEKTRSDLVEALGVTESDMVGARAHLQATGHKSRQPGYGVTDTGRGQYGSEDFALVKGEKFMVDGVEERSGERQVHLARPVGGGRFEHLIAHEEQAADHSWIVTETRRQ